METQFITQFKEVLEIEDRNIELTDKFREFEEWDSLAYLSIIAMIDEEYNVQIEGKIFKQLETINNIIKIIKELKQYGIS